MKVKVWDKDVSPQETDENVAYLRLIIISFSGENGVGLRLCDKNGQCVKNLIHTSPSPGRFMFSGLFMCYPVADNRFFRTHDGRLVVH